MGLQNVLLVVQLIVAVALVAIIVLFQRTSQDGGGLMGGGSTMGGLFTARGSANVLTRATAFLATLFILNSLALGYLASSQHRGQSLLDQVQDAAGSAAKGPATVPVSTAAPAANVKENGVKTPVAPAAPSAPQVPLAK